jgi:hypothetical protein
MQCAAGLEGDGSPVQAGYDGSVCGYDIPLGMVFTMAAQVLDMEFWVDFSVARLLYFLPWVGILSHSIKLPATPSRTPLTRTTRPDFKVVIWKQSGIGITL